MENYLDKLNEQQRQAVVYCDGPQLVIAGAGSGKTRVLTYKIVHLLAHDYEPWRIMALTFTNKAAREMRERIQALVGEKLASKLWMGTFHSIFLRILRANADRIGFRSDFTIYDTTDTKSLIKAIIKDMDLDDKVYKVSTVMSAISNAKNALVGPRAYAADRDIRDADRRGRRERLHEIYTAYMHRCHVAGAMDFDDILYYINLLFRDNPDVLSHYQQFFRYILVDEYQDTNFAQHLVISQLCSVNQHLCVVGDDAQSIYSFRGANIRNILNLRNAYPNLVTNKLEQNYRSTQTIINAANSLIDKNTEQIHKQIFSTNAVGDPVEVVKAYSDYEEAYLVASRLSQVKMKSSDSYEEFAILYRTNAQSRILEEALRNRNIPYRIYGGTSFYQRKEVKDALAYFRLSVNPDDDEALRRIINTPTRGIGETTVKRLLRAALDNNVSMWAVICDIDRYGVDLAKAARTRLGEFAVMIQSFIDANNDGVDALVLAQKVITDTRLLSVLISDKTPESISKQENLQELLAGVQEYVTGKLEEGNDEEIYMADFLSQVSLATDQDEEDDDKSAKVTLMTIHAAKGLEFANIFIVGVEEDLLPSAMSLDNPMSVEEERRLLYVAITRAKKFCMISYAASRYRNGETMTTKPSRFLYDIDSDYLNFTLGTDISKPVSDPVGRYGGSFHSSTRPSTSHGSGYDHSDRSRRSARSNYIPVTPLPMSPSPVTSPASATETNGAYRLHSVSEVAEGMTIEHSRFGRGTIIAIDTSQLDARIKVSFDNVEVKTIMLKFAQFKILD